MIKKKKRLTHEEITEHHKTVPNFTKDDWNIKIKRIVLVFKDKDPIKLKKGYKKYYAFKSNQNKRLQLKSYMNFMILSNVDLDHLIGKFVVIEDIDLVLSCTIETNTMNLTFFINNDNKDKIYEFAEKPIETTEDIQEEEWDL